MDEHGIDLAWLLTWEIGPGEDHRSFHGALNPRHMRADGTHGGIPLGDLIQARDRYPDRFVLGYCPHPLLGDAAALFEAACRMHGVRVCGEWKFQILLDDPRCIRLFRKAGELGCPVVLHIGSPYCRDENGTIKYVDQWYGGTIEHLERALQACPETNFIGHAPGFWNEISGGDTRCGLQYELGPVKPGGKLIRLFDTYPNLYGDLSARSGASMLRRDRAHSRSFLISYADRLLFGRDQYGDEHFKLLQSFELPSNVMQSITIENAQKLLPFSPSAVSCNHIALRAERVIQ